MTPVPKIAVTSPKRRLGRSTVAMTIASLASRWAKNPALVRADARGGAAHDFSDLGLAPHRTLGPMPLRALRAGIPTPTGVDLLVLDLPPVGNKGVAEICETAALTIMVLPTLPRAIALSRIANELAPTVQGGRAFLINALTDGRSSGVEHWRLVMAEGRTCPIPMPFLGETSQLDGPSAGPEEDRMVQLERLTSWILHHAKADPQPTAALLSADRPSSPPAHLMQTVTGDEPPASR